MSNDLKELKDTVSGISTLIPEIYFDIICRFTPGAITLLGIWSAINLKLVDFQKFNFLGTLFLVILAYATGLILDCFTNMITSFLCIPYGWKQLHKRVNDLNVFSEIKESSRFKCLEEMLKADEKSKRAILDWLRERARLAHPYATQIMPKINAEERFAKNLGVGLLFTILVLVCSYILHYPELFNENCLFLILLILLKKLYLLLLMFICVEVLLFLATMDRIKRTVARTVNWFLETESKNKNN